MRIVVAIGGNALIAAGEDVQAWRSDDYWLDIGRPEDYDRANEEFPVLRSVLITDRSGGTTHDSAPCSTDTTHRPASRALRSSRGGTPRALPGRPGGAPSHGRQAREGEGGGGLD